MKQTINQKKLINYLVIFLLLKTLPSYSHDMLPEVIVNGHYDNSIGTSNAASEGSIGNELIESRGQLRPGEVLEYIPGMVVTQHSGDGKANQYFLRGMNLDHGTDFSTTVNGVPVNMPTHAHGQGYSDLNFLIPELVQRIDYKKGPYFASEGDFSSAGSANIILKNKLDQTFTDFTVGQNGYLRGVGATSNQIKDGIYLLSAVERVNSDGPWVVPEGLRKANAQFILSSGSPREGWDASFLTYSASWTATDQVPQSLIDSGKISRFGSMDSTDGGKTNRTSLSGTWHSQTEWEQSKINWYLMQYDFDLFSNFTYYYTDQTNGDQFEQKEKRTALGGSISRSWFSDASAGRDFINTLGLQLRQDYIRVGLYSTAARQVLSTTRDDYVKENIVGVYGENETTWNTWIRTLAGVRADALNATVDSYSQSLNSGSSHSVKLSPKFSVIFGPFEKTEFFFNIGRGFHSNDARGTTLKVEPTDSTTAASSVPGLVSSTGKEIGIKSEAIQNLQTTLAIWQLDFDSELVYSGDTGSTDAGRPSTRSGIEWSNHWVPNNHFLFDANLAWTRPRYSDSDSAGSYIPNAVEQVANLGLAFRNYGPWSGSINTRYIGAAALIENNSVRSSPSVTTNLRVNRKMSKDMDISLDVLNLMDKTNNDISYYYASRVSSSLGSDTYDTHVHPAEPRTFRATLKMRF